MWLITGKFGEKTYPSGLFSIVRETLPSLRATAYKDFTEILQQYKMYHKVDHVKTQLEFHFQGRTVAFFPTDDINSQKLRGRKHTFFYMNEANTIKYESFNQMIMRTEEFCILDYNPEGIDTWCRTEIEVKRFKRGDVFIDVSTYKDNLRNLAADTVKEIEGLKETDIDLWKVYTKGEWVKSRALVFSTIHLVDQMPDEYEKEFFGLDFGYNDPCVIVRVVMDGNRIYIEELFYAVNASLHQIQSAISNIRMKHGAKIKIYADHNPILKAELRRLGARITNAKKGKDSIMTGLAHIRKHSIHITKESLETIREFRTYKYKLDDDNKPTDNPLDKDNHAPDAVRYALSYSHRHRLTMR